MYKSSNICILINKIIIFLNVTIHNSQNIIKGGDNMAIKTGLEQIRETHDLSQTELASKLNVELSVIKGWESGAIIPLQYVIKISKLFNTSVQAILFADNRKPLNISNLKEEHKELILSIYNNIINDKQGE